MSMSNLAPVSNPTSIRNKTAIARTVALAVLAFMIIYNISFTFSESFTTGRIAIVILLLWAIKLRSSALSLLKSKRWLLFFPLPYVAVQFLIEGDPGQLSRFFHLALYAYIGSALFASIARDIKVALSAIQIAITLQSAILFFSFFSMEYRIWFDSIVNIGANYSVVTNIYRAPGFTSAAGASLSVIQSLGVLVGGLLLRRGDNDRPLPWYMSHLVFSSMILSMLSCVLVGRTGIILSAIFIMLILINLGARRSLHLVIPVAFVLIYLSFFSHSLTDLISSSLSDNFSMDYFNQWAFGFMSGDLGSVDALVDMEIPPLSIESLHGTGLVSIVNGANPSGHDSGFIQTYYSIGLPLAFMFYAVYLVTLFTLFKWVNLPARVILTITFFTIEYKEPFLFKYSTMFTILVIYLIYTSVYLRPKKELQPTYEAFAPISYNKGPELPQSERL